MPVSYFIVYSQLFCVFMLSHISRVWLIATLWTIACQAPLFTGFSRQKYWSGLSFLLAGDLPNPGIKPAHLTFPALTDSFFSTSATWEALGYLCCCLVAQSCPSVLQSHGLYIAHQVPLPMGFSRQEYWSRLSISSPGNQTHISCIGKWSLYHWVTREAL